MQKQIIIDNELTDYEINSEGYVFSHKTNKKLTGSIYASGYCMVRLTTKNKGKKAYCMHRLVAEAFIPNPYNLPVVNHKDGNKLNNNVDNLEWVTQSQNRRHAIETKISNLATGKRNIIENIKEDNLYWKRYKDTNYLISIKGEAYNTKTKILLKATPKKDGYVIYSLRIDGKTFSKLAHVLVIEVWKPELLEEDKIINHKDGNKSNNNIDNLEVISKRENIIHACYTLNKNIKPVIKMDKNGVEIEYPSISFAARENGITPGAITYAIKNNGKCCQCKWKYK